MIKTAALTLLAIAVSFSHFVLPSPPKSFYHSLFISSSLSDNVSISHHLRTLTRRPHVAGSEANQEAADYVLSTLTSNNIPSHVASYQVLLAYPISRSLKLRRSQSDPPLNFDLRQESYESDPYASVESEVLPTFYAYAKSGNVSGPVVYANYGRLEDFNKLGKMGVNVFGCVVLARAGEIYRGSIVQNAMKAGAAGVVVYVDKKDYGGGGDEKWFPDGRWMPPSGVQVGSVFTGVGDPATPGWPSIEGCERISEEEMETGGEIPQIPSLPVSGADGEKIMEAIGGPVAEEDWQGRKGSIVYRIGPGPGVLDLSYNVCKYQVEKIFKFC